MPPGQLPPASDESAWQNNALLIDKPLEWTSFAVCAKLRGALGVKKVLNMNQCGPRLLVLSAVLRTVMLSSLADGTHNTGDNRAESHGCCRQRCRRCLCVGNMLHHSGVRRSSAQCVAPTAAQIGHAGTLDPLATGLLIVCTGKGTKSVESFMAQQKVRRCRNHAHPSDAGAVPSTTVRAPAEQRSESCLKHLVQQCDKIRCAGLTAGLAQSVVCVWVLNVVAVLSVTAATCAGFRWRLRMGANKRLVKVIKLVPTTNICVSSWRSQVYSGVLRLGQATSSYDAETAPTEERPWQHLSDADLTEAAAAMTGDVMQMPPMFSAIKVKGDMAG